MGVYKKGGSWYVDYRVGGRRIRERVGPSRKLAETVLGKRQMEIAEGTFLNRKTVKETRFDAFADDYLAYSRTNKRNFSRECYLMRKLRAVFGPRYLTEITSWDIERYKGHRKAGVSPATVNRDLTLLKHMFTKAIEWGRATANPVRGVKFLREANTRLRFLSEEEESRLLAACSGELGTLVLTALHTGFRRGELLSLRWAQVDFATGIVSVEAAYTKNGERRSIPMSQTLGTALQRRRQQHLGDGFVFDELRSGTQVYDAFQAALREAEVKDFRFHDLRHTFASRLVMAGVDIRTVQDLLGHKTLAMTLRYSHLSPTHRSRAIGVLDGVHGVQVSTLEKAKVQAIEETDGHYLDTSNGKRSNAHR
jgi:integrase